MQQHQAGVDCWQGAAQAACKLATADQRVAQLQSARRRVITHKLLTNCTHCMLPVPRQDALSDLKAEQQQYAQGSKHDAEWTNQNSMMVNGETLKKWNDSP